MYRHIKIIGKIGKITITMINRMNILNLEVVRDKGNILLSTNICMCMAVIAVHLCVIVVYFRPFFIIDFQCNFSNIVITDRQNRLCGSRFAGTGTGFTRDTVDGYGSIDTCRTVQKT